MKRLFAILFLALSCACMAQPSGTNVVTAVVTMVHAPTNGVSTISVDTGSGAYVRTWTSNVTAINTQIPDTTMYAVLFTGVPANGATITNNQYVWTFTNNTVTSPSTQVLIGTNSANSATNYYNAFEANPNPFMTMAFAAGSSNMLVMYSYFGVPLTVTNTSGFASIIPTNDLGVQTTNLYYAYGLYKVPAQMNVFWTNSLSSLASNQIAFQSYPGYSMTVAFDSVGGWATVSYSTYTPTNMLVLRVPAGTNYPPPITALGPYERTNAESGIIAFLNDQAATNWVLQTNLPWRQFLGTNFGGGLTNFILSTSNSLYLGTSNLGVQSTNFTLYASNSLFGYYPSDPFSISNYTLMGSNYTTAASNSLWTLFDPLFAALYPWIDAPYGDVYLTNGLPGTNAVLRLQAVSGGEFDLFAGTQTPGVANSSPTSGKFLFENTLSGDSGNAWELTLQDYNGWRYRQQDRVSTGGGWTLIDSYGGAGYQAGASPPFWNVIAQSDFAIADESQEVNTAFPITFGTQLMPATATGAVTNFFDNERNTSTSTPADAFTIPANTMTNNGDMIERHIAIALPTSGTGRRIQVPFADIADLVDTGTMTMASGGGFAKIDITITRTGPNAFSYSSFCTVSGVSSSSSSIAPSDVTTNFVFLQRYTNTSGAQQFIAGSLTNIVAAAAGQSTVTIAVSNTGYSTWSNFVFGVNPTAVADIGMTNFEAFNIPIATNGVYVFTNTSTGGANAAGLVPGTGHVVTIGNFVPASTLFSTYGGAFINTFNSANGWASSSAFSLVLGTSGSTGDLQVLNDVVKWTPSTAWPYLP